MEDMKNPQGKTLTIFVILITILLVSSTAIGFFMYQKENQMRKDLETQLEENRQQQDKLTSDLKDSKKQLALLQDKNKEADAKINSLMDEIELNEGLHNALKKENVSLKEALETAKREKEAIHVDLDNTAKKLQESQEILKAEQAKIQDLQNKIKESQEVSKVEANQQQEAKAYPYHQQKLGETIPPLQDKDKMELGKIIVNIPDAQKGRIMSVDKEAEFVICNIGTKQGVKSGDLLSVYRADEYLGDIKVSRIQDEMSAADLIPPLSVGKVRKNDIVVLKQS